MKTLRLLLILIGINLTAGLIFAACKKDQNNNGKLVGTWINTTNPGQGNPIRQEVYLFNNDKTMVVESTLFEAGTKKPLGYSSRIEGSYELKGDSIRFYNVNTYGYSTQPYYTADRKNLTLVSSNKTYTQHIVFNGTTSFHFKYDCPPNASCMAMLEYTRETFAL